MKACTFYHPKVCYGSLATPRVCLKKNCTYRNLPETKRAASRREEVKKRKEEKRLKEEKKKDKCEKKEEERRRKDVAEKSNGA